MVRIRPFVVRPTLVPSLYSHPFISPPLFCRQKMSERKKSPMAKWIDTDIKCRSATNPRFPFFSSSFEETEKEKKGETIG